MAGRKDDLSKLSDLKLYYSRRAPEYDAIYSRPERQRELLALERLVTRQLANRDVLEIACGTGYWTHRIAGSAGSILATDASPRMLEMAGRRSYRKGQVTFQQGDAFAIQPSADRRYNGFFAGFWWSHVPRERVQDFLRGLHERLDPGSRCIFVDNRYVHGESTSIATRDEAGNTYQDRRLLNGLTYRILKNFPDAQELRESVSAHADNIEITEFDYFWCLSYESRSTVATYPPPFSNRPSVASPGGPG